MTFFKAQVHWDRSYDSAIQSLKKSFDISIFDNQLDSGKSTQSFLSYLKEQNINLPVIVISEGKSRDSDIRLLRSGASDYLLKSNIRPSYLERCIRYALERHSTQSKTVAIQHQDLQERKLNALGEFASNIAQDLGQYLELIEDGLDNIKIDTDNKNSHDSCKKYIKRARNVIKNLSVFSPHQTKVIPNIDLKQLILESTDFLNRATKKNINVVSLIDTQEDLLIDVNPSEIKQALANLVLNAQDAMPTGGNVQIKVSIPESKELPIKLQEQNNTYVAIDIKDSGCGINLENKDRIFEPTYTTKKNKSGLGLGLSAAFSIVKAHQGWISVDSVAQQGSVFSLYLPLSKTLSRENRTTKDDNSKGLVMVIEPDYSQNQICKLYFEAAAYESRVFNEFPAAIRWYEKNYRRVDLVMLEVNGTLSPHNCFDDLITVNPEAKVVLTAPSKTSEVAELIEDGALKFFPSENKYLAAISWISDGLKVE